MIVSWDGEILLHRLLKLGRSLRPAIQLHQLRLASRSKRVVSTSTPRSQYLRVTRPGLRDVARSYLVAAGACVRLHLISSFHQSPMSAASRRRQRRRSRINRHVVYSLYVLVTQYLDKNSLYYLTAPSTAGLSCIVCISEAP